MLPLNLTIRLATVTVRQKKCYTSLPVGWILKVVAAQNMDYVSAEIIEEKIATAITEGLHLAKEF